MITSICGLLENPDNMRRCAAAITLTELAPKDKEVIDALGKALEDANQTLTTYLLEALEAIGSVTAVPYVLPLLDSEDMATRLRAVAVMARGGAKIVPQVRALLKTASPQQKLVLADLLARLHTRDAFATILELVKDPKFSLVREACDAAQRHLTGLTPKEQTLLHGQVIEFMKSETVQARERLLASCLMLLGAIGKTGSQTVLLKYAAPDRSPYIRRHALLALRGLTLTAAAATTVSNKLMPFLDEEDSDIVRLTLDVVGRLTLSTLSVPQARQLLNSKGPAVRAFAAHKLGEKDDAVHNRVLLELLGHHDAQVVDIAARTLADHSGAAPLLADALAKEKEEEKAWQLAKILRPHAAAVKGEKRKALHERASKELRADRACAGPLLYFLQQQDPDAADKLLLDAGMKHWRAKRWQAAVDCLRRLVHSDLLDAECVYALAVCNLKLSAKELSPHSRESDYALRGFRALLRDRSFSLLDRIKKDKTLEAGDDFYVGFHFAESAGEEKTFGKGLLQHVGKTWPRSKDGKAAKSKLKLT